MANFDSKNVAVVYYFLDSNWRLGIFYSLVKRDKDYCLVRKSALNVKILILQKLYQINVNRWIIYKKIK